MSFENVVNLHEVEPEAGSWEDDPVANKSARHYRARQVDLAGKVGAEKLGFGLWELPPGSFSCPYHYHVAEEELFLVLKGKAVLRMPEGFQELKEGDLVSLPTGPRHAHQFHNHTDEPFRMLALSTISKEDVCEYPDSGKILIRGQRRMVKAGDEASYLQGEEDPGRFWPVDHRFAGYEKEDE